jgi:hypothetical protein
LRWSFLPYERVGSRNGPVAVTAFGRHARAQETSLHRRPERDDGWYGWFVVPVLRVLGAAGYAVLRGLWAAAHRWGWGISAAITHRNHAVTRDDGCAAISAADAADGPAAPGTGLAPAVAAAAGRIARGLARQFLAASAAGCR